MEKRKSSKALMEATPIRFTFTAQGEEHEVEAWPLTWRKNKKIQDSCTRVVRAPGAREPVVIQDTGTYEFEILKAVVKDSTIPDIPGSGWERLHPEFGEAMFKAYMESSGFVPDEDEEDDAKKSQEAVDSEPVVVG